MIVADNGNIIMSIEDMQVNAESDIPLLIQIGYMQSDCNEERMVDLGDAVRILFDEYYNHVPGAIANVVPTRYDPQSLHLYGTTLRIWAAVKWNREFPNNTAGG